MDSTLSGGAGRVRRDRRGRGMRGPLAPPQVPLNRSRAERFDDLVLDAVDYLERRWSRELATVEFAVDDVPPVTFRESVEGAGAGERVPFSHLLRATRDSAGDTGKPATSSRIVIYRRPLETRASSHSALARLVYETVVNEVANLLGVEPRVVDPALGDDGEPS